MWTVFGPIAWEYSSISGPKADEDVFAVHGWRRSLGSLAMHYRMYCLLRGKCNSEASDLPSGLDLLDSGLQPLSTINGNGASPGCPFHGEWADTSVLGTSQVPPVSFQLPSRLHCSQREAYLLWESQRCQLPTGRGAPIRRNRGHKHVHKSDVICVVCMCTSSAIESDFASPRTSGTNCARWYNETFSNRSRLPEDDPPNNWPCGFKLDTEHVWDVFVILSLLEHAERTAVHLEVPHSGYQKDRFMDAMISRNSYIIKMGQPELVHACNSCMHLLKDPATGGPLLDPVTGHQREPCLLA